MNVVHCHGLRDSGEWLSPPLFRYLSPISTKNRRKKMKKIKKKIRVPRLVQESTVGYPQNSLFINSPCRELYALLELQSPKGDISYLQKFFLMYVGGRAPLHLQEDFCGTALLSYYNREALLHV
ncbi:uncharacterized protein LOC131016980 [Salvia miltiorrhiza]|uniref:uncharacterized protein LOC131016980 n=1 Tax=Salvia miltiorrhiza TaxID=226208 RepID=UPI0025AD3373|nr:uncharacterized protein LOC131016980 [Salvia miltiorrhiza]